jgi:hypothetical protein
MGLFNHWGKDRKSDWMNFDSSKSKHRINRKFEFLSSLLFYLKKREPYFVGKRLS